jgi:hemerythrin-like domain-containing protein
MRKPEDVPVSILEIIKKEHREASAMLDEAQKLDPDDAGLPDLAKRIEWALTTHVEIEERLFYAQLRKRAEEQEQRIDVFEAYTEHEVAAHLIAMLKSRRKRDERFKAELQVLGESIKHHVQEEESTIFSLAKTLLTQAELDELGLKWQKARRQLPAEPPKATAARKKAA